MNIKLDQNGIIKGQDEIENKYISYGRDFAKGAAKVNNKEAAGFSVQLGGVLSDNGMNAYADNKKIELENNNNLSNELAKKDQKKNYQILMSETVSKEELGRLEKDGFEIGKLDPTEVVTITDKIKATMANSGVVIEGYNDNLDSKALESVTGSKVAANALERETDRLSIVDEAMDNYDLPKTSTNKQTILDQASRAINIEPVSEEATKFLLKNDIKPTFENIYKAEHLGGSSTKSIEGYYNNDGFLSKRATGDDIANILDKVDDIIAQAGYETSEELRKDAIWMVENGIELTDKSFGSLQAIKQLPLPATFEQAANAISAAIKNTADAKNAVPGAYKTVEKIALEKIDELDGIIADEQIKINESVNTEDEVPNDKALVSRMRMLNEARLAMTVSNTSFLIKNGIDIDFSDLEQLVDNLKEAENVNRQILFGRDDAMANERADRLFDLTNEIVENIPALPAKTVGIFINRDITLRSFYTEGKTLQGQLVDKYEPLMTSVRSDLGDSISKAFRNVDDLLNESGMEITKENEKAVRILGYNELPITKENIDKIRLADEKLARVIGKMKPGVTLSLIRDGINPIDMDIDELEAKLNERQKHEGREDLKYSEFLVKLEEADDLTAKERDSYIGIYRALHQIEKRDGAALGGLIDSQMEMTLGNLLKQARIKNHGSMDINIDDSYGLLDKKITSGTSITDQIMAAFDGTVAEHDTRDDASEMAGLYREAIDVLEEPSVLEKAENVLLEIGQMKGSIENRLGVRALLRDRAIIQKGIKLLGSDSQSEASEVKELVEKLTDEFTDRASAQSAYEEMSNSLVDALNEGIYQFKDMYALRDISSAIGALNIARSLARNEYYEIPVTIGDNETSISVQLIKDSGRLPSVSIYTECEEYGRVSASFTASEAGLEGMVMSDRIASVERLEKNNDSLMEQLSSNQINVKSIFYTENKNTGLPSVAKDNRDSKMESEAERIDTKDLYRVAKEFISILLNA